MAIRPPCEPQAFNLSSPLDQPPLTNRFFPCYKQVVSTLLKDHLQVLLNELMQATSVKQEQLQAALKTPGPLSFHVSTLPVSETDTSFTLRAAIYQGTRQEGSPLFVLENTFPRENLPLVKIRIQAFSHLFETMSHFPVPPNDWAPLLPGDTPCSVRAQKTQALAFQCMAWLFLMKQRASHVPRQLKNPSLEGALSTYIHELIKAAEEFQRLYEETFGHISPFFPYAIACLKESSLPKKHLALRYLNALSSDLALLTKGTVETYQMICTKALGPLIKRKCGECEDLLKRIDHSIRTIYDAEVRPHQSSIEEVFAHIAEVFLLLWQIDNLLTVAEQEPITSPTQQSSSLTALEALFPTDSRQSLIKKACDEFEQLSNQSREGTRMSQEVEMLKREYEVFSSKFQNRIMQRKARKFDEERRVADSLQPAESTDH